jgi:hypothetical protein
VVTVGQKGYRQFQKGGVLTGWSILSSQPGASIVFDVTKSSFASFPPVTSIVAAAPPTLATAQSATSTTLTGWTTTVAAGDVFGFSVSSASVVTRVTLELYLQVQGITGADGRPGITADAAGIDCCESDWASPVAIPAVGGEATLTTTGTINDLVIGPIGLLCMNNASLTTITGIKAGQPGQLLTILSVGAGQVDLPYQNTGSAVGNRLLNAVTSGVTSLAAGKGAATYRYDTVLNSWVLVSHTQGAWITVPFSAGNFTASGAMTWTVGSGNVTDQSYLVIGNTLIYSVNVSSTTIGGTPDTELRVTLPSTFVCVNTTSTPIQVLSPGLASIISLGGPVAAQTYVRAFSTPAGANWAAGATAIVRGVWTFPLT